MQVKIFKKQVEVENFIKELKSDQFYKLLSTEKGLFRTITTVLFFNQEDIKEYLVTQLNTILEIFAIRDFQKKVYLNDNQFYIRIDYNEEKPFLLKNYGYVISAIQNLLVSYIFNKFNKWYWVLINVNNHLHNQKYFLKKQIYFAIKNIRETERPFHFKPMPNNLRKMVHELVKEIDGFSSFSQGSGFLRHIVIKADK